MCVLDQRAQLLFREGRLLRSIRTPAIVGIDLDPVGTAPRLLAHGADDLADAARLLGTLRRAAHIGTQATRCGPVRPRSDDRARRDEQARPLDEALLDRALERQVSVLRTFGAEIAERGEPGEERRPRLYARAQRAIGRRLLQHLVVP